MTLFCITLRNICCCVISFKEGHQRIDECVSRITICIDNSHSSNFLLILHCVLLLYMHLYFNNHCNFNFNLISIYPHLRTLMERSSSTMK